MAYGGTSVLRDITLTIERGERVAIVGRSGAGKTSLLTRLYEQQRGHAALVPQDLGLVRSLSVFHNIFMGRLGQNRLAYNLINLVHPPKAEIARVAEITNPLDLTEKMFAPIGELSGGQQQRVAVGRALYYGGSTILADEPISALDRPRARRVMKLIADRHETVLIAMHDIDLALELADRIIGIADGTLALDEPAARLNRSTLDDLSLVED